MAQRNIDFGSFPDDPNADAIRTAFDKVQQNFTELFSGLQDQAVISVNRTAGTGTTVNSPTGNVIISANIAQVRIQSTTLDLSTGSNASPASLAVINQGTVPIFINLPQSITGIANITLSGTLTASNVNVSSQLNGAAANFTGNINSAANVTAGNVYANAGTIGASLLAGTLTTAAQPNITSVGTLSTLSVSGNVSSGNANLGNLATANFFSGDGSLLTNVSAVANTRILNGTSFANIPVSGGNLNVVIAGNPTMNVTATGANITGTLGVTGNLTAGNLVGILANGGSSNITIASATGNVTTAVAGTARITATSTGANVTGTLGVSSTLEVTGNANVGNLGTAQVLATANVTAPQLISNIATGTAPLVVTSTTRVANLNVNYANVADFISVAAGTGNNFLIFANAATGNITEVTSTGLIANLSNNSITATTFVGALSGAATTAGTVTTAAQPNITSIGTLTALGVNGNIIAANINANTGVFTGNGSGLSAIAGANVTGTVPNATAATTAGTVTTNAQPNITSVGTLTGLGVNGTVTAVAFTANTGVFIGNGAGLSQLAGANVTGTVANATFATSAGSATTAGTVTTAAQPNITSVGTLTGLAITGNLSSGNANLGNAATANFFIGSGNNLSNIQGANVTGAVASATAATTAGTVTTNAQPNITSVGTLSTLSVSGNLSSGNANLGNAARANFFVGDGSLLTNIAVGAGSFIENGNSEVRVDASSNIRVTVAGNANVVTFTGSGANIAGYANVTGNVIAGGVYATLLDGTLTNGSNTQPNIRTLGTLTGLTVSGVSNLGPNSNVIITGGAPNAFLRTNGSGNLTWDTATLVPAQGANTQVIFNDGGSIYAGSSAFTFDKVTNILTVGNISGANNVVSNFFTGTIRTNAQPNITSVGTLASLNVNNTVTAVAFTANTGIFTGNGSGLTALTGANVTGTVASATTAGTVTTNAQPNITSVGTLTTLGVNNTVTAVAFTANTGIFTGNGSALTALNANNISSGTLAQARLANSSLTVNGTAISLGGSGTITANTTQTLTLGSFLTGTSFNGGTAVTAAVDATTTNTANKVVARDANGSFSANIITATLNGSATSAGTATAAGSATTAGTVTTNAQPNITSVGTLTSLDVTGNVSTGNVSGGTGTFTYVRATGNTGVDIQVIGGIQTTANGTGGKVQLIGATGKGTGDGGAVTLQAGSADSSGGAGVGNGIGGFVTIAGGSGWAGGIGGDVLIRSGGSEGFGSNIVLGGAGNSTTGAGGTIGINGGLAFGTNKAGGAITIAGGRGTGTGQTGNIVFQTTDPTTSGATNQTLANRIVISGNIVNVVTSVAATSTTSGGFRVVGGMGVGGNIYAGAFYGPATGLTAIPGANVTGTVANATFATSAGSATTAGTVTTAAQGNITSVGTLTGLTVGNVTANTVFGNGTISASGNANVGNLGTATAIITTGNITTINSGLLQNGTSNVVVAASGGNVTLGVAGTGRITATTTGANVTGTLGVSGNANVGNLGTARVIATGNISGTQLISNVATGTAPLTVASTTQVANLNAATAGAVQGNFSTISTIYLAGMDIGSNGFGSLNLVTGIQANFAQNSITATTFLGNLTGTGNTNVGNLNATGYVIRSVGTGIIALGLTQLTAVALTKEINVVSTVVPLLNTGVRLPVAVPGMVITIVNTSGNTLSVWPNTGADINGAATNAAYSHSAGATLQYVAPTSTDWYTVGATFA